MNNKLVDISSHDKNIVEIDGEQYDVYNLPDNLEVEGNLNLRNTDITSLPDNLIVKGDLYLENTNITSLPDNLKVGDNIYISKNKELYFEKYKNKYNIYGM